MPETNGHRKMIHCKGTIPGTGTKCDADLFETDGRRYLIGELVLELDPPRVRCDRCGYVTRLVYRKVIDSEQIKS